MTPQKKKNSHWQSRLDTGMKWNASLLAFWNCCADFAVRQWVRLSRDWTGLDPDGETGTVARTANPWWQLSLGLLMSWNVLKKDSSTEKSWPSPSTRCLRVLLVGRTFQLCLPWGASLKQYVTVLLRYMYFLKDFHSSAALCNSYQQSP